MLLMDHRTATPQFAANTENLPHMEAPSASSVANPVLARLMDEVRNENHVEVAYDRVHNRHNRGR